MLDPPHRRDEGNADGQVGRPVTTLQLNRQRRLVLVGLAAAALATLALVVIRFAGGRGDAGIGNGRPAPALVGTTLDGAPFDLASLRGRPVIVNFWGPGCVPCRDEFPLFNAKLQAHAADGLAIVGVLMYDAPAPARDFVAEFGAGWPTVLDESGSIRTLYRVAARPQSYFVDRDGVLRSIQVGELTDADFERQYAAIVGSTGSAGSFMSAMAGVSATRP